MKLPNFLIVGAAKSGTSSLCDYLKQHPQVYMPVTKEPNFFVFEGLNLPPFSGPADPHTLYQRLYKHSITNFESYQELFQGVSQERAIGEASVRYLYFPQAAERIKKYIPNVKLILILRNPIDRLYSHYLMMKVRYRLEPLSLARAIEQEEERVSNNWGWDWHYVRVGMYYHQVKHYLSLFDRKQIKVFLYDDFCTNPLGVFQEVCQYIDVDDTFLPDMSKRNRKAYWPRSFTVDWLLSDSNLFRTSLLRFLPEKAYQGIVRHGKRLNSTSIPPMSSDIQAKLVAVFKEDILNLQQLIQRELPWQKNA
ncbi:sulfotransferase [Pleurocapsales cyanobacterium LEGE 10410]|nr:sulfotransferase [Pleurocapsales cyanobacterium LEGE 10410]